VFCHCQHAFTELSDCNFASQLVSGAVGGSRLKDRHHCWLDAPGRFSRRRRIAKLCAAAALLEYIFHGTCTEANAPCVDPKVCATLHSSLDAALHSSVDTAAFTRSTSHDDPVYYLCAGG